MPCADVLNVIYTDGNYVSTASPSNATINGNAIQALSVSPVSAFSYFDQVARQETVFAGTGTGVQQLNPDGSWSVVNLITTQITALIGQAMSFIAGNFLNTFSLRSNKAAFTTGTVIATVSATTFIASSVTLQVGNVFLTNPGSIILTYSGYKSQGAPNFGTLVKDQIGLLSAYDLMQPGSTTTLLQLSAATDLGQGFFIKMNANGVSLAASAASYSYTTGIATWTWTATPIGFAQGSTYNVTLS